MKLSIIVTAFNEQNYIERCLKSLANQKTEFDYEVIVINDGSTDNTKPIIEKWVNDYGLLFKSFDRKNCGQGASRNFGIKRATGEYIGFADADDWVDTNFVQYMCKSAQKNKSDVVVCDVHKIFVSNGKETNVVSLKDKSNIVDISNYITAGQSNSYSWNKIYKREIWNDFEFKKMVYEDLDIVIPILSHCKLVSYVPKALYNYFKHEGTTTSSYSNPRLFDIFKAYEDLLTDTEDEYKKEAEFCTAKRMMINFDTSGFKYYLGYFINFAKRFNKRFSKNELIKKDLYVRGILYLANISTLNETVFIDSKNKTNIDSFRFTESVQLVAGKLKYEDVRGGGIIFDDKLILKSPFGFLKALPNFVLLGESSKVLAIGFKQDNPIIQRLFKKSSQQSISNLLLSFATEVISSQNIAFDTNIINLHNSKNKEVLLEVKS